MRTAKSIRKLLLLALSLLMVLILVSCQKDNTASNFPDPNTLPKGLVGTWIEVSTLTDTISFTSNDNLGVLWLQRGYEIRNGYRLPIIGSTGYEYKIFSDSINLINGLSSIYDSQTYPFVFDESKLVITIGKFSKYINTKKSTLTFRKIK